MDVLTLYEKNRPSTTVSKEIKSFLLAAMRESWEDKFNSNQALFATFANNLVCNLISDPESP